MILLLPNKLNSKLNNTVSKLTSLHVEVYPEWIVTVTHSCLYLYYRVKRNRVFMTSEASRFLLFDIKICLERRVQHLYRKIPHMTNAVSTLPYLSKHTPKKTQLSVLWHFYLDWALEYSVIYMHAFGLICIAIYFIVLYKYSLACVSSIQGKNSSLSSAHMFVCNCYKCEGC